MRFIGAGLKQILIVVNTYVIVIFETDLMAHTYSLKDSTLEENNRYFLAFFVHWH